MNGKELNALFNKYSKRVGYFNEVNFYFGKYYYILPEIVYDYRLKPNGLVVSSKKLYDSLYHKVLSAFGHINCKLDSLVIENDFNIKENSKYRDLGFVVCFEEKLYKYAKYIADKSGALFISVPIYAYYDIGLKDNSNFIIDNKLVNYSFKCDTVVVIDDKMPIFNGQSELYGYIFGVCTKIIDYLIFGLSNIEKNLVYRFSDALSKAFTVFKVKKEKRSEFLINCYLKIQVIEGLLNKNKDLNSAVDNYVLLDKDAKIKDLFFFSYSLLKIYSAYFNSMDKIEAFFPQLPDYNKRSEFLENITGIDEKYFLENFIKQIESCNKKTISKSVIEFINKLNDKKDIVLSTYKSLGGENAKTTKLIKYCGDALSGENGLTFIRQSGFLEDL